MLGVALLAVHMHMHSRGGLHWTRCRDAMHGYACRQQVASRRDDDDDAYTPGNEEHPGRPCDGDAHAQGGHSDLAGGSLPSLGRPLATALY